MSKGAPSAQDFFRSVRRRPWEIARQAAIERLRANWDRERLMALGAEFQECGGLELPCLSWRLALDEESLTPRVLPEGCEAGAFWQVLTLDYLCAPDLRGPVRMVSFADMADARTYAKPFQGRVLRRLEATAARDEATLIEAAERCGGVRGGVQPLQYVFRFFPRFELHVVHHPGDDEFPAACNVLFPHTTPLLFSIEDAVVAAEKLVACLNGRSPLD